MHGCLTSCWVDELRQAWKRNHQGGRRRECTVDLDQVTYIDECGERLLRELWEEGARITASGVYNRRVIEQTCANRTESPIRADAHLVTEKFTGSKSQR